MMGANDERLEWSSIIHGERILVYEKRGFPGGTTTRRHEGCLSLVDMVGADLWCSIPLLQC
jgi:hypothetical protein